MISFRYSNRRRRNCGGDLYFAAGIAHTGNCAIRRHVSPNGTSSITCARGPAFGAIGTAAASAPSIGQSTCVTFAAYQSAQWKCHRYEVDGSHSYGHYFYTSEIAYHTIDGADSIMRRMTVINGDLILSPESHNAGHENMYIAAQDDRQVHVEHVAYFQSREAF